MHVRGALTREGLCPHTLASNDKPLKTMTRSDALDIIDRLPKSLSDIAVKTETSGVAFMAEQLDQVGIDGEAFLAALKDDLIESLAEHPRAQESLEEQMSEALGSDEAEEGRLQKVAGRFKEIAESSSSRKGQTPMYSPDDEVYGQRIDERMS